MSTVLDTSATIAWLIEEPGAQVVQRALDEGETTCSAANWAEVVQKAGTRGYSWRQAKRALLNYGMRIEPVVTVDAEWAGFRFRRGENLSLADRLCMALADRLDARILTADHEMAEGDPRAVMIR